MYDVACFGFSTVDWILEMDRPVRSDEKLPLQGLRRLPGGQAATAAVALSRWGLKVRYAGSAGDDEAGRFSLRSLRDEAVDTAGCRRVRGASSHQAFVQVEPSGTRTILWHRPEALNTARYPTPRAAWVHLDGQEPAACRLAARQARAAGLPVSLDMESPDLELAALCDVVVADRPTGEALASDPVEASRRLASLGARFAGVTLGAEGAVAVAGGRVLRCEALDVEAVDTTGAGDVFHAGVVYGLALGWDDEEALRFATAAASLSCRALGGRGAIPTAAEALRRAGLAREPALDPTPDGLPEEAFRWCRVLHRGQCRDEGTPYSDHPVRVARSLRGEFGVEDPEVLSAALLHDVLEDTWATAADLRRRFGPRVARLVEALTKRGEPTAAYLERLSAAGPDAVTIKLADRLDNVRGLSLSPVPGKIRKYADETRSAYLPMARQSLPWVADLLEAMVP